MKYFILELLLCELSLENAWVVLGLVNHPMQFLSMGCCLCYFDLQIKPTCGLVMMNGIIQLLKHTATQVCGVLL